jgi:hypothetical protein
VAQYETHQANTKRMREGIETALVLACSIRMLSRAQWYRQQANLALQRGHETRVCGTPLNGLTHRPCRVMF